MSQDNEERPSPRRASSTAALIEAFRSITSSRPKSAAAHRNESVNPLRSSSTRASFYNDTPALLSSPKTRAIDPSISYTLSKLAQKLKLETPLYQRIKAIDEICELIDHTAVGNASVLWSAGRDLIDRTDNPAAYHAGCKLLASCCKLDNLTPREKNTLFHAISKDESSQNLHLRLEALTALTKGGRSTDGFEVLIPQFLVDCLYFTSQDSYSNHLSRGPSVFTLILQYILELLKFNAHFFSSKDLNSLISELGIICSEPRRVNNVGICLDIFDTIVTYAKIPRGSVKQTGLVLCDIHQRLEDKRERAWLILCNIFKSHLGEATVAAMLGSFCEDSGTPIQKLSSLRSVFGVLYRLFFTDMVEKVPQISVPLLISVLKIGLESIKSPGPQEISLLLNIQRDVIEFIVQILTDDKHLEPFLEENWTHVVELLFILSNTHGGIERGGSDNPDALFTNSGFRHDDFDMEYDRLPSVTETKKLNHQLSLLIAVLSTLLDKLDIFQREMVMRWFMNLGTRLTDSTASQLLDYFIVERLMYPPQDDWLDTCRQFLYRFYCDKKRPSVLRARIIQHLRVIFEQVQIMLDEATVLEFSNIILSNLHTEHDLDLLNSLCDFAIELAQYGTNPDSDIFFDHVVGFLESSLDLTEHVPAPSGDRANRLSQAAEPKPIEGVGSAANVILQCFVKLFLSNINKSLSRSKKLYSLLLRCADSDTCESDARITALRLLFRLRADSKHRLYVLGSSESEGIAAVLCRTEQTAWSTMMDERASQSVESERQDMFSPRNTGTRASLPNIRIIKPIPPLWMSPDPKGLPGVPPSIPSNILKSWIPEDGVGLSKKEESSLDSNNDDIPSISLSEEGVLEGSDTGLREKDSSVIQIESWLELIISLIQRGNDWEVYSYVLVHLAAQLMNRHLFRRCALQLGVLRATLCEQIRFSSFCEPPIYTSLKRGDVAVCIFHTMTAIISYHPLFEKHQQEDVVKTFLLGIGNFDRASKWCIHALSLCCHELPYATEKHLSSIIIKMAKVITQPHLSIHILEFLVSLSRLPDLYRNFREDDFKTVFGVAFRFLQYVREKKEKSETPTLPRSGIGGSRRSVSVRDSVGMTSHDMFSRDRSAADDVPQYVYALAYHVIGFWFMALKMSDRSILMDWIAKKLRYDDRGQETLEDQAEVTIDMMRNVAWSDVDETASNSNFATEADGEVSTKSWIVGTSLMTIETAGRTGVSQITIRRPTSTRYTIYRPSLMSPPAHQVPILNGLDAETFDRPTYVGVLPDAVLQSTLSTLDIFTIGQIIPLPDDATARRAISTIDRTPTVDGQKIGVVYIGPNQTSRAEILSNEIGPKHYLRFVESLGCLVPLKGAKFNTQGLDRSSDSDGQFAPCWRDRVIEIVFHVTTMMPNDPYDPDQNKKFMHIGNDYVNIIFNESGNPYRFDTLPSQFSYVYIDVSPVAPGTFRESIDMDPDHKWTSRFYRVQVITKPGFPEISPAAETKVVSEEHLAGYVRLIALNACFFSLVWSVREGGQSVSSWNNRLRLIKNLRAQFSSS